MRPYLLVYRPFIIKKGLKTVKNSSQALFVAPLSGIVPVGPAQTTVSSVNHHNCAIGRQEGGFDHLPRVNGGERRLVGPHFGDQLRLALRASG